MLALQNKMQRTFWDDLEMKVQEIGQRNKVRISSRGREEASSRVSNRNRCQVDRTYHKELDEENKLQNRIVYLQTERQKQQRTLNLARHKYEKVMEIRLQSRRQKQQFKQRREEMKQKTSREVTTRASRIRTQRKNISISMNKIKQQNESEANSVRLMSVENQQSIIKFKSEEKEHNKEMVVKAHGQLQKSKVLQSKRHQLVLEYARNGHESYLNQKIRFSNTKQRKNSVLKQKLHDSLVACSSDREKCVNQLRQYTTLMRQRLPASSRKYSSTQDTLE